MYRLSKRCAVENSLNSTVLHLIQIQTNLCVGSSKHQSLHKCKLWRIQIQKIQLRSVDRSAVCTTHPICLANITEYSKSWEKRERERKRSKNINSHKWNYFMDWKVTVISFRVDLYFSGNPHDNIVHFDVCNFFFVALDCVAKIVCQAKLKFPFPMPKIMKY